jgi:hypothetical protein
MRNDAREGMAGGQPLDTATTSAIEMIAGKRFTPSRHSRHAPAGRLA